MEKQSSGKTEIYSSKAGATVILRCNGKILIMETSCCPRGATKNHQQGNETNTQSKFVVEILVNTNTLLYNGCLFWKRMLDHMQTVIPHCLAQ